MHCTRKLNDSISWVGGNDRRLALFENLFPIPRGVSYNSYLITDEKTALIDTVDASISHQFLENIYSVLDGRSLDYLVIITWSRITVPISKSFCFASRI